MPGMVLFENVQMQLVDMPPLSRDYMEPWMSQIARTADALLLVVDLSDANVLEAVELLTELLQTWKILPVAQALSSEQDADLDSSIVPLRTLLVGNKADVPESMENWEVVQELYGERWPLLAVSVSSGHKSRAFTT